MPASAQQQATASPPHGTTRVELAELMALRARAGKPELHRERLRTPQAGGHVSALRGRGMDYAESRIYQPGDDVRNIDWRRTARSGKWHTKLFEAEREQALLLLIDTHPTMRFGTRVRYKSVAAARAAAWLAWTGMRAGDRVGALAFGSVHAAVAPHPGTRGTLAVLGALARWDARARQEPGDREEPLSRAIQRAYRMLAPGSRAMLLSDGWCVDDDAKAAMVRLARRVDLRAGIVVDALEHTLAPAGVYAFQRGQRIAVADLTRAAGRTRFGEQLAQGWRQLASVCDAVGVRWTLLPAEDDLDRAVGQLWRTGRRHP